MGFEGIFAITIDRHEAWSAASERVREILLRDKGTRCDNE